MLLLLVVIGGTSATAHGLLSFVRTTPKPTAGSTAAETGSVTFVRGSSTELHSALLQARGTTRVCICMSKRFSSVAYTTVPGRSVA